nr:class I SAM-dependent methyltransferase [Candidatus Sigynarchaeota archaeon]
MARKDPSALDDDWFIENERPEEKYGHPAEYWTDERIERLLQAKGQARIQQRIARSALDHVKKQFPSLWNASCKPASREGMLLALDAGCGLGFSADVLVHDGCTVIGIDIIPAMLRGTMHREISAANVQRGRYHPCMASMLNLPFRPEIVDIEVSISAAQWMDTDKERRSFSDEARRVLRNKGKIAIQFYPKSKDEMMRLGTTLKQAGFQGGIVIDNPDNPRKRKVYIVMERTD